MAHFFVAKELFVNPCISIGGADARHIGKVLRLAVGDSITLSDGAGRIYDAVIKEIKKDEVVCCGISASSLTTEPGIDVVLIQGIPKSDKMDYIVQKGVELGVREIIPLECERVVARFGGERMARRLDRWRRIAAEAAKQCRRARVPKVSAPLGWEMLFHALAGESPQTLALMPWEQSTASFKQVLDTMAANTPSKVYIIIGPEGGFTPTEASNATKQGVHQVSLGPRILRTETAGLAATVMVLYHYGDLGVMD